MRLRHRPWKLLPCLLFGTLALVVVGVDLLDGFYESRRHGLMSISQTPGLFWLYVAGHILSSCLMLFGWLLLREEWNANYRSPPRPSFVDPERSRPFRL